MQSLLDTLPIINIQCILKIAGANTGPPLLVSLGSSLASIFNLDGKLISNHVALFCHEWKHLKGFYWPN